METVLRACAVYAILLAVFRVSDKRTLNDANMFDLLLLLVISETIQQALIRDDSSLTTAIVLVVTFVSMNIGLSVLKQRSRVIERIIEDVPLVIVDRGQPLQDRMDRSRVDMEDVMEAARMDHGLESLHQVRYAVLERSGRISIIPTRRGSEVSEGIL